jgi:signal transduction histidine kinase
LKRWYWMAATMLALGALSLLLLVWTDHVAIRQRSHFALANGLMDLQIATSTAHLWLEEAITGKESARMGDARSNLQEGLRLSGVLRYGGEAEHGLIVYPVQEPELLERVEHIDSLVAAWASISFARIQDASAAGEGSPMEDSSDVLFVALQRDVRDLELIVEGRMASDYAESRRLFVAMLATWAFVVTVAAAWTLSWQRSQRRGEVMLQRANTELESQVSERTAALRGLNDQLRVELAERKKAEAAVAASAEQLRQLSGRLLEVQEEERSRISRALHDQLGHSLILIKLGLGLMRRELGDGQAKARDECDNLLARVDDGIDDVRKISKVLRPAVLDELGLIGALRWLLKNLKRGEAAIGVDGLSLADVDNLFTREMQIVVFRIVQEALTNVEKHASAKRVSLSVRRECDRICFAVEDDGKGFGANEAILSGTGERGLGLATMEERAHMLGGSLAVWSEEGQGTRITLSVPIGKEGGA